MYRRNERKHSSATKYLHVKPEHRDHSMNFIYPLFTSLMTTVFSVLSRSDVSINREIYRRAGSVDVFKLLTATRRTTFERRSVVVLPSGGELYKSDISIKPSIVPPVTVLNG